MLLNSFRHIPSAGHSCREGDKISLSKGSWWSSIVGNDRDLARQEVTRFAVTVRPGKLGNTTTPSTPVKDAFLFQKGLVGLGYHLNIWTSGCIGGTHFQKGGGTANANQQSHSAALGDGNKRKAWNNQQQEKKIHQAFKHIHTMII